MDGDELTYTVGTPPANGSLVLDPETGEYTYTPNEDFNGDDSFTVIVDDGNGGSTTVNVPVTVTPVNDAPVASDNTITVDEESIGTSLGLSGPTDVDGDPLTITVTGLPLVGAVTLADGTPVTLGQALTSTQLTGLLYNAPADYDDGDAVGSFTYTVDDGQGEPNSVVTGTVTIGVNPVNDPPVVGDATAVVSEKGLADNTGNPGDTTNPVSATGTISISDPDADAVLTVTLSGPAGLTSGGVPVTWSGDGTAGNPLVGSAGGVDVLEATIDGTGNYSVTLKGPVDHALGNGENVRDIALTVNVNDGETTGTGTLTVAVEDDTPTAVAIEERIVLPEQDTNVMLILDISGSMTQERMTGMKLATSQLLDTYAALGDVSVRIVVFGTEGDTQPWGAAWTDIEAAKGFVNGLPSVGPSGGTNYDAALIQAMGAFASAGKIDGAKNVSYFLTDGEPLQSTNWPDVPGTGGNGLNDAEEAAWKAFLDQNEILSQVFGMTVPAGQQAAARGHMDRIAYDGINQTDTDSVLVNRTEDLPPILRDSVDISQTGDVFSGGLGTATGADGGSLGSIEVNGTIYHGDGTVTGPSRGTWNNGTSTWTIDTLGDSGNTSDGGRLTINMQGGTYTYLPPIVGPGDEHIETIGFTLVDRDGDGAEATLTITVHPAGSDPDAGGDAGRSMDGDFGPAAFDFQSFGEPADSTADTTGDIDGALLPTMGALFSTYEAGTIELPGAPGAAPASMPPPAALPLAGGDMAAPYTILPMNPLDELDQHHAISLV